MHDECDKDQLWFDFGGQLVRLSITDRCLVIEFCNGVDNVFRKANIAANHWLRYLYFNGNLMANIKQLDENFEGLNFNDIYDIDALKITL